VWCVVWGYRFMAASKVLGEETVGGEGQAQAQGQAQEKRERDREG